MARRIGGVGESAGRPPALTERECTTEGPGVECGGLGTHMYKSVDGARAIFAVVLTGLWLVCCSCRLAEGGVSSTRSTLPVPLSDADDSPFDSSCLSAATFSSGFKKQLFSTCGIGRGKGAEKGRMERFQY